MIIDSSGASGGYLSCFGKKDTKEADQRGDASSRSRRRAPLDSPGPFYCKIVQCFGAARRNSKYSRCYRRCILILVAFLSRLLQTQNVSWLNNNPKHCTIFRWCVPGGVEGRWVCLREQTVKPSPRRFFGYFLIGIRKYRPRQGPEPSMHMKAILKRTALAGTGTIDTHKSYIKTHHPPAGNPAQDMLPYSPEIVR